MKWFVLIFLLSGCVLGDYSKLVELHVTITCTSNDGPITCPADLPTILDINPSLDWIVGYEDKNNVPVELLTNLSRRR